MVCSVRAALRGAPYTGCCTQDHVFSTALPPGSLVGIFSVLNCARDCTSLTKWTTLHMVFNIHLLASCSLWQWQHWEAANAQHWHWARLSSYPVLARWMCRPLCWNHCLFLLVQNLKRHIHNQCNFEPVTGGWFSPCGTLSRSQNEPHDSYPLTPLPSFGYAREQYLFGTSMATRCKCSETRTRGACLSPRPQPQECIASACLQKKKRWEERAKLNIYKKA